MRRDHSYYCDVLVIGSGAAGLALALSLPEHYKVAILSKGSINEGNTAFAQGGIATVMSSTDSIESHIQDTVVSGDGLCDLEIVKYVVSSAKKTISWLIKQGVNFTIDNNGSFHLTKEGGHSHRRVLHSDDATGLEIESSFIKKIKKTSVEIYTEHTAIDLIQKNNRCVGAYVLNNLQKKIEIFQAKFTVLATGGSSKIYLYSSNPDCSTGDGIAMAYRAGCAVTNMEFNQFHPTCLYHPYSKSFLITEALRGEGGKLVLPNGKPFMHNFDKRADLAPRDIVTRAIYFEMKRLGINCVYLDVTHKSSSFIKTHFPNVYKKCLKFGIDITKHRIPVSPAAHYTCGGIVTNKNGHTTLDGLYALGETACTGLHGANRIASNSLLECIVYGRAVSLDIIQKFTTIKKLVPHETLSLKKNRYNSKEVIEATRNWKKIAQLMWDNVGIVCTNKSLAHAQHRIGILTTKIQECHKNSNLSRKAIELQNMTLIANIIINAAITRKNNIRFDFIA